MSFSDAPQVNQSVMPIHDDVDAELPAYLYTITSFVEMASQLRDGITFREENDEAVADGIEEDQYVVQTRFIQFMFSYAANTRTAAVQCVLCGFQQSSLCACGMTSHGSSSL